MRPLFARYTPEQIAEISEIVIEMHPMAVQRAMIPAALIAPVIAEMTTQEALEDGRP